MFLKRLTIFFPMPARQVRVGMLERDARVGKNAEGAVGSPRAVVAFGL
jgi:hypothetical protein